MSQALREQLSALMDGELPKDQMRFLLRGMDADAQLVQSWSRYQLASAVIRRQAAFVPVDDGFADRVMQAVAQQAPGSGYGVRVLRWAGGGAIAAAVAVIALVGTRPAIQSPIPSATIASVPATAMPVQPPQNVFMPIAPSFDYAQPASFDSSVISLPRYDQRMRYAEGLMPNAQVPYVLLIQPPQAPAAQR